MTEPSIYARALDVLDERGWTQGQFHSDQGEVCLIGALVYAAVNKGDGTVPVHELKEIGRVTGGHMESWNDTPGRTEGDVKLLLKYADADELDTWKALYGPEST